MEIAIKAETEKNDLRARAQALGCENKIEALLLNNQLGAVREYLRKRAWQRKSRADHFKGVK